MWILTWILVVVFACAVAWGAAQVSDGSLYKPGDEIGYNMGLIGGLMMLAMFSYPLRKRSAVMRRWGDMKYWFSVHMMLGIFGPTLVLFHSTFQIHSVNAGVALASMLIVASSGLLGRYAYRHMHHGLYGSVQNMHVIREELLGRKDHADSKLTKYPEVIFILHRFQSYAMRPEMSVFAKMVRFFALPLLRQIANIRCKMSIPKFTREDREARLLVLDYLYGVERAAQFKVFEHIFRLWHVIHIPLVFMLVGTAIWHVIAVHMY